MTKIRSERGFALIAVLVVLAILTTLAAPFLLGMGNGEAAAIAVADQKQVDLACQSARDLALAHARRSHPSLDETPLVDDRREFPDQVGAGALAAVGDRMLLSAELEDLQRRINLTSASPAVYANLLGLGATLASEHEAEATELQLEDASGFPDRGYVVVDRELIRYGQRDGNVLRDLERGLLVAEEGFQTAIGHGLARGQQVLDYRCVLAATWAVDHAHRADPQQPGRRDRWTPWGSVGEVARIARAGFGGFDAAELDRLQACCTVASVRESAGEFGRSERLFSDVEAGDYRLLVRSAVSLAAGTIVRLRNLADGSMEYGMVWSTHDAPRRAGFNLPTAYRIELLRPVTRTYPAIDTLVEPLLQHPINLNTVSREVLIAAIQGLRPGAGVDGGAQKTRAAISRREAEQQAELILALRGDGGVVPDGFDPEPRPFESFEDLAQRLFKPQFDAVEKSEDKFRLAWVFISFMQGTDGNVLDFALPPITFTSGAVVGYRAAAAANRPGSRGAVRIERSGIAVAMPGIRLDQILATQLAFEDAARIERQTPWYHTGPINIAGAVPFERGTEPAPRYFAYLIGMLIPEAGLGGPRFPSKDGNGAGFQLASASTPNDGRGWVWDSMFSTLDPNGRNVDEEGPYRMTNSGPKGGDATQPRGPSGGAEPEPASSGDGKRVVSFPFTGPGGFVVPHGTQFWFQPRDTRDQVPYDLNAGDMDRNRISVQFRGNELLLEVLDEAGLDPEPTRTKTQVERTAGIWKVPLNEIAWEEGMWAHVNASAHGNRADQLCLTIDGMARGQPNLMTWLAQQIPEYRRPSGGRSWREDTAKYLPIRVESTDTFPDQGVLRIGLELFEYTSKDATTFYCAFDDSFGGRVARMDLREYRPEIPLDQNGRPTVDIDKLTGGVDIDFAPAIEAGAMVELYGFSLPVYRQELVQVGSARLAEPIGAFAVARGVVKQNPRVIEVKWGNQSQTVGHGMDETWTGEVELADPLPDQTGSGPDPQPASEQIQAAFPAGGGYALLVQKYLNIAPPATTNAVSAEVGGVELIQYGARQGHKLTNITRNVQLPPIQGKNDPRGFYTGRPRQFVSKWAGIQIGTGGNMKSANEYATYMLYVVPISLPIRGNIKDPSIVGITEWVQLEGARPEETEWVRYDWLQNGNILRADLSAWNWLRRELTQQDMRIDGTAGPGGISVPDPNAWAANPYPIPPQYGTDYIGFTPDLEVQLSVIHTARMAVGFRGDPFTRTSSHPHNANTLVLQCHRFEQDWGNYGARSARTSRNDRVALIAGSSATGENRPPIEWHTVNWVARMFTGDLQRVQQGQQTSALPELLGPYPFQLVAFQDPVRQIYQGPDERNDALDVRQIDRLVKFPSGELPAAWPPTGDFGGGPSSEPRPMRGLIDEVAAVQRTAEMLMLDEPLTVDGESFVVVENLRPSPVAVVFEPRRLTTEYPDWGGLVMIGGEILAVKSHSGGSFQVATEGRGLLGTLPRAHAPGEPVQFLEQIPAAILAEPLGERAWEVIVQNIGSLPRHGALLRARNELLHYTWSARVELLEMPRWYDPDATTPEPAGLFRGRFGTTPESLPAGAAVIGFPFRYWDRQHARAEDPELAHWQVTLDPGPVFFDGLYWEDDQGDLRVRLECLVRTDGQAPWNADPTKRDDLWLFERGRTGDDGQQPTPNRILRQGSRLEARFRTVYLPGAYDPVGLRVHTWKRAPTLRALVLDYEGEGRLLSEQVTAR